MRREAPNCADNDRFKLLVCLVIFMMNIFYDKEADILEITMGEPVDCYFDEIDDDLFEAHDKKTHKLKGYKVFNFIKRSSMKNVKIPLQVSSDF